APGAGVRGALLDFPAEFVEARPVSAQGHAPARRLDHRLKLGMLVAAVVVVGHLAPLHAAPASEATPAATPFVRRYLRAHRAAARPVRQLPASKYADRNGASSQQMRSRGGEPPRGGQCAATA